MHDKDGVFRSPVARKIFKLLIKGVDRVQDIEDYFNADEDFDLKYTIGNKLKKFVEYGWIETDGKMIDLIQVPSMKPMTIPTFFCVCCESLQVYATAESYEDEELDEYAKNCVICTKCEILYPMDLEGEDGYPWAPGGSDDQDIDNGEQGYPGGDGFDNEGDGEFS